MRIRKAIKLLTIFSAVFAFAALGTAWSSGSAKAEETNKLQNQKTSRQRLRDGSGCTTGGGFNINGYNNNADTPGNTNTGNRNRHGGGNGSGGGSGNGNNSGADKIKAKGNSR